MHIHSTFQPDLYLAPILLVTGHYGSGKTTLSVNLALDLKKAGRDVVLCDLDIVNPYFRSADFQALMHSQGIATISPTFAGSNLDMPALGPGLSAVVRQPGKTVIVDVGGDDAGAVALGRYAPDISSRPYTMLYLYNRCRYLTREPQEALEVLGEIEAVSRLRATHLVNSTNLGDETDEDVLLASQSPCATLSELSGLPVLFQIMPRKLLFDAQDAPANVAGEGDSFFPPLYPIDIQIKKPWERDASPSLL